jgi:predicted amino acid dehydrogenase
VTANCTSVATNGVALTSGNSYTTALGVEGLKREAKNRGIQLGAATVGIVGAKGNIGSISARLLAQDAGHIVLFGREATDESLLAVAHAIYQDAWERISAHSHVQEGGCDKSCLLGGLAKTLAELGEPVVRAAQSGDPASSGARIYAALQSMGKSAPVRVSADLSGLGECDAVVTATSSAQPVIFPEHLSQRTAVICDIATPSDTSDSVAEQCPWVTVISGGLARLPSKPDIQLMGTKLPVDHVFGCVAETCLLGLVGYEDHFSFGDMDKEQVEFISAAAKRHGFGLGEVKRSAARTSAETRLARA